MPPHPAPPAPDAISWHVRPPVAQDAGDGRWHGTVPAWLAEVRRFRAVILHADGLRPTFRDDDGRYRDDDPADLFAHHVVATVDGRPVATLRVVPLASTGTGFCERLLGTTALDRLLDRLGSGRADAWEGSGWAVQPGRRRAATSARVLAAGEAVARELGLRTAIGASGSRYGQLYRILSVGYRRADLDPVPAPGLADDVQIVHGTFDTLRPTFQALVEQTADLLEWHDRYPTRVNEMTS